MHYVTAFNRSGLLLLVERTLACRVPMGAGDMPSGTLRSMLHQSRLTGVRSKAASATSDVPSSGQVIHVNPHRYRLLRFV